MANMNNFELKKNSKTKKNHRLRDDNLRSSNSQQLRSSAISHGREKLDNLKPFSDGDRRQLRNSAEIHMLKEQEALPPPKTKCDVRKSLAWDKAFFTSPGVLDLEELLGTVKVGDLEDSGSVTGPRERVYLSSDESMEPERTSRIGKCNLRRSLAWDSAFLTGAGVLDPDELCIINKGLKRSGSRGLSGIEELQRSVDSNSTMDAGSFSLESLELELFEVRMSQQKATASNIASSSCRKGTASKKMDASSRSRMTRPMSTSSKQPGSVHGPERTTKEVSGHPRGLQSQHTARSVELNPSALKQPKIVRRRASSIPAAPIKRSTLGAKHVQDEDDSKKDASGQHVIASKKQCLRNSSNVSYIPRTPRSAPCTPRKEYLDFVVKSPPSSLRRNTYSRNVVNGSTLSSPARIKQDLSNSSQHSSLLPLPNSSFTTSLASSIDSSIGVWSSESTPLSLWSSQTSDIGLPQLTTSPDLTDIARKSRPSGLRKPSPKLGFFDGMSSRSPTGVLQYQRDMKGTPLSDADSVKHTKLPTVRTSTGTVNTKTGVLSPLSVRASNLNHFQGENALSSNVSSETNPKAKTRGTVTLLKNKLQRREDKGQVCGRTRKQSLKRHAENGNSHLGSNLYKPNLREKENVFSFEDHVNSLSNHIGAFNLGA